MSNTYTRYTEIRERRERTLRLFESLHQNDDPNFRRASGSSYCHVCGLQYREHPPDMERTYFDESRDQRLCEGDIVHL